MSLQAAFRSAQSAIATNAHQTAIVSRNVSGADTSGYSRRIVLVEPGQQGQSSAARIIRAADTSLQSAALDARSIVQRNEEISKSLEALQQIVGDPTDEMSPTARLAKMKSALLTAAYSPQDRSNLLAAVDSASSLATYLRDATTTIQKARARADADMAISVVSINSLLESFQSINAAIVSGQLTGDDVTNAQDSRDAILLDLSKEIGISTVPGPNGDMSIYTDSGVPLFQRTARTVSMQVTEAYSPSVGGQAVYVDGVAVTGSTAPMPLRAGALAGLSQFRDDISLAYQSHIDELAVGLISAFSEAPRTSSSLSASRVGLFTWSGAPAAPPPGLAGVATSIRVDPSVELDPTLLRDGGIGGSPDYVYNVNGAASFSSRLYELVDALGAPRDTNAPFLSRRSSVNDVALQSQAWLEGVRQQTDDESTNSNAILTQATAALSNAIGVNVDDQMSRMLDLENSYQAAAKMMATIDSMYAALFSAIRGG